MPAKDKFHDAVKNALEKDGWTVMPNQLPLKLGGKTFYVDLGAEKLFAAEKAGRKIAVEVKGFLAPSLTYEFHAVIGQYINYGLLLQNSDSERVLYLAVPNDVYNSFLQIDHARANFDCRQ